jgi:cytochrome c-type biogenesis protein CcmE
MTRKRRRLYAVVAGLTALGVATTLVLLALGSGAAFFFSPTEVLAQPVPPSKRIRIGGLVEEGSVKRDGKNVEFRVTDRNRALTVAYTGILPDLFREGQGVVSEGVMSAGVFRADTILAKHDENYMPREVADALKKQGHWQGEEKK